MTIDRTAIIALCDTGLRVALDISTALEHCDIFIHQGTMKKNGSLLCDAQPFESVMTLTSGLFNQVKRLVFVLPTGVAVRAIAPHLHNKHRDPAVVTVDVGGRWAVSLLSGHEGGANQLALNIANAIGAEAVVSTTTEAEKTLIVGVGCRRGTTAAAIGHAVKETLQSHGLCLSDVRLMATADVKRDEPGIWLAAKELGVPLRVIDSAEIRRCAKAVASSRFVMEKVNLPGVAEPAALLAGRKTALLITKQKHVDVTVAVAKEACTSLV
jgi:cobalt-precorrin 5A hydrolase